MPLKLSFSAVIAELGYHIMRAGMMARSTCVSSAGSSREKEEEKAKKKSPDRYSTLCCVCIDAIVTLGVFLYLFDFGQRVIYTQKTLTFIPNHLYSFFFSLSPFYLIDVEWYMSRPGVQYSSPGAATKLGLHF